MKKIYLKIILLLLLIYTTTVPITACRYVIDNNSTITVHISIDKVAPKLEIIDINKNKLTDNSNIAIEKAIINYEDELSGIEKAIWKYNPKEENFEGKEENKLDTNTTFTEIGWYDIELTDKAGNTTIYHFYIGDAVCRIEDTYFTSIKSALDTISENNTNNIEIIMLKNTTEDVIVSNNKTATLNIDNFTINGSFSIEDGSTLTTKNGNINTNKDKPVFNVEGNLNIESGNYEAMATDTIIVKNGVCNIKNGNVIHNNTYHSIHTYNGVTNVTGGLIANYAEKAIIYLEGGTVNLTSGEYVGNNKEPYVINNKGTLNVEGATINSKDSTAISSNSNTNIKTGSISSTTAHTIIIDNGKTNITGGNIANTNNQKTILINNGNVNILGGNLTSRNNNVVLQKAGNVEISNGTLTSSTWCVYGINAGNLKITGGLLRCNASHDALHISGGTTDIIDGTFETKASNSAIVRLAADSDTGKYFKDITLNVKGGKYNQTTTVTDLKYAVFDVAKNIKSSTINFEGVDISTDKYAILTNNSTDTIVNVRDSNLSSSAKYVLFNLGQLNIFSGYINSTGEYAIYNSSVGTVNIHGGKIENKSSGYAIYKNSGIVNVLGGTILGNINY